MIDIKKENVNLHETASTSVHGNLQQEQSLKKDKGHSKVITENGAKILEYLQKNWESKNNIFKATEIGEGLFMSGRSVSGSIRKLVSLGFVEKQGKDPVCYSITDIGKSKEFD